MLGQCIMMLCSDGNLGPTDPSATCCVMYQKQSMLNATDLLGKINHLQVLTVANSCLPAHLDTVYGHAV